MDGRRGVPRVDVQDEVGQGRERLRRWGWVSVALGLPGLGLIGYGTYLLLADSGYNVDVFYIVGTLLALPAPFGVHMIAKGWAGTAEDVRSVGSPRRSVVVGWLGSLAVTGGLLFLAIPTCGCSTRERAYGAALRSDLKNLAGQQEIYFSDYGSYSADARTLGFVSSQGVQVYIHASQNGWAASAWHQGLGPEVGCALWWGAAPSVTPTRGGQTPVNPGEIVCDEQPSR